jgi:hypothetical protein
MSKQRDNANRMLACFDDVMDDTEMSTNRRDPWQARSDQSHMPPNHRTCHQTEPNEWKNISTKPRVYFVSLQRTWTFAPPSYKFCKRKCSFQIATSFSMVNNYLASMLYLYWQVQKVSDGINILEIMLRLACVLGTSDLPRSFSSASAATPFVLSASPIFPIVSIASTCSPRDTTSRSHLIAM